MRKYIVMLVMFISMVANVNAQIVTRQSNPNYIVLSDGRQYWRGSVPGGAWMSPGDNFTLKVNQALQNIYTTKGAEAYQRALYNWQTAPYTMVTINGGVYGGGVMVGGGNVMIGGGNGGMVYGNGGMAGANSNVIITNDNMASTIGTGTYMNIDKNGVSISGDVVGGGLRVLHEVGSMLGGSKKKNQQTTTQVVYVDSATGQVIGQQPVQTTTTTRGTNTTTRSNTVQQNNNTQYQVVYNASTGQYVRVPVK